MCATTSKVNYYAEGYITRIEISGKDEVQFKLEPASPFAFRYNDSEWIISVGRVDNNTITSEDVFLRSKSDLFNVSNNDPVDSATLVQIKASHTKVGVGVEGKSCKVKSITCL